MSIDAAIVDYSAGVLLRYFRGGGSTGGETPRAEHRRDLNVLRGHWAVSGPVQTLVNHLLQRPHEAHALLSFREGVSDGVVRGRIDARKSHLYRMQTGRPTALVSHEAVRTFQTGPNMLLAWVLREASTHTGRLLSWQGPTSPYLHVIEAAQAKMRLVQRLEALRDPLRAVESGHRPGPGAAAAAARSRKLVYRLAVDAFTLLQGLEHGDPSAIQRIARSALIGPLEDWRRFELAVGLSLGEALARRSGAPLQLSLLGSASAGPIVRAGRFAIYWQQQTGHFAAAEPEPSEVAAQTALRQYGLTHGADRPDLLVVDEAAGCVVSVVEVKYVSGDTANARFREALDQVIRYGRSYAQPETRPALLNRSLVAISRSAPTRIRTDAPAPFATDFATLSEPDGLDDWATALMPAP